MELTPPIQSFDWLKNISQLFGVNRAVYEPRFGLPGHNGLDIVVQDAKMGYGTKVYSAHRNPAICTRTHIDSTLRTTGHGVYLQEIQGDEVLETVYWHLSDISIKAGDRVMPGQVIGLVGNTGFVMPPPTSVCPYCLTEDAVVFTREGTKQIKDVSIGEEVLDENGEFSSVLKTFKRDVDSIFEVQTRAGGEPLQASGEHPFLVIDVEKKKTASKIERNVIGSPRFVEARELKEGQFIALQTTQEEFVVASFGEYDMDEDMAYLIGLYLSEGHLAGGNYKREVVFSFHAKEHELISFVKEVATKLGINYSERTQPNGTSYQISLYSAKLALAFKVFGEGAKNKTIPESLLFAPHEIQEKILWGVIDGDGHEVKYRAGRFQLKTISRDLAYQSALIVQRLGYLPSVNSEEEGVRNDGIFREKAYTMTFSTGMGRTLHFNRFVEHDGKRWIEIVSIREIKEKTTVYNLSVEGSETFVANLLVTHNCGSHLHFACKLYKKGRQAFNDVDGWVDPTYYLFRSGDKLPIFFRRDLYQLTSGDDVSWLQTILKLEGFAEDYQPIGYFGNKTRRDVSKLQTKYGINPTLGYFGTKTRQLLNSKYSRQFGAHSS